LQQAPEVAALKQAWHGVRGGCAAQPAVREDIKEWLKWLRNSIGFDGWRFDFVKGYSAPPLRPLPVADAAAVLWQRHAVDERASENKSRCTFGGVHAHRHSLLLLLLLLYQKDAYSANALQMRHGMVGYCKYVLVLVTGATLTLTSVLTLNLPAGGEFVKEYLDATVPEMAFGEFWDTCEYADGVLNYNQDAHRQRTVNWCDRTGGTASAFDFTTKGAPGPLPPPGFMHGAQRRDRPMQRQSLNRKACVQLVMCITCKGSAALSCRSGTGPNYWRHARRCMRQALSNPYSSIEHHCTESIGVSPV